MKRTRVVRGFLRSDAKPNFSNEVYEKPRELDYIAKRPVVAITKLSPIIKAVDVMVSRSIRRLPVVDAANKLIGLVTSTDLINFFGGGDFFNIIKVKHRGNFYSAINEPIEQITARNVIYANLKESFVDVLEKMVKTGYGAIPLLTDDGKIYGIITERDVVNLLAGKPSDKKVEDVMTTELITIDEEASVEEASKRMISNHIRRLPVLKGDKITGIVVAMDLLRFFGGDAFRKLILGNVDEVMSTPVREIMSTQLFTVSPKDSLGSAAELMRNFRVGSLLVLDADSRPLGIITERDLLLALTLR